MVWAKHIRKLSRFEMDHVLGASRLRNDIEYADTPTVGCRNSGKLAQNNESRSFDTGQGHVGDDQSPLAGFQLGHQHVAVCHDANVPSQEIRFTAGRREASIPLKKT